MTFIMKSNAVFTNAIGIPARQIDAAVQIPLCVDKPLQNPNANSRIGSAVDSIPNEISLCAECRICLPEESLLYSMMVQLHFHPNVRIKKIKRIKTTYTNT